MNKRKLFKTVLTAILSYILISWILPLGILIFSGEAPQTQIGLVSTFLVLIETLSGFGNVIVYVLLLGIFYGIVKATGMYEIVINKIASKLKENPKLALCLVIIIMAIISSICGLDLGLLVIFPFVIAIITTIGYDEIVALTATVASTIVGIFGATFASTYYGVTNTALSTTLKGMMLPKVILFIIALILLVMYVLKYISKKELKVSEVNAQDVAQVKKGKKQAGPKVLEFILGLVVVIFILGTTLWSGIFGFNLFENAHDAIMKIAINGYDVVNKMFGGITALGTWNTPYRLQYYSVILLSASLILKLVYKIKGEDLYNAVVGGLKEYIVPAALSVLALSLFVFSYYYPILETIQSWILGLTKELNVATASIYSIISSICYPDFYYYAYYAVATMAQTFADSIPVVELISVTIYGLIMFVAPTSLILLITLSLTNVSYKEWIKYIWKYVLALLVISLIIFVIATTNVFDINLIPISVFLSLITVLLCVISVMGLWKIFEDNGEKGWKALIPVYNLVVLFKILEYNPWLVILMFITPLNVVMHVLVCLKLANKYNKKKMYAIALVLFPFIVIDLAFSSIKEDKPAKEVVKEDKKKVVTKSNAKSKITAKKQPKKTVKKTAKK